MPPAPIERVVGEIVTEVTVGAAPTVTAAEADFAVLAALVAVTVSLPAVAGAVYPPVDVILPRAAFQVTDLLVTVPETLAENCCVPLTGMDIEAGEMLTEFTTGVEIAIVAEAVLLRSA